MIELDVSQTNYTVSHYRFVLAGPYKKKGAVGPAPQVRSLAAAGG